MREVGQIRSMQPADGGTSQSSYDAGRRMFWRGKVRGGATVLTVDEYCWPSRRATSPVPKLHVRMAVLIQALAEFPKGGPSTGAAGELDDGA